MPVTSAAQTLRSAFLLDPEVVYINHGSFGACPRAVLDEQVALRERMEREPVRFLATEHQARVDAVRAELAPFVGAQAEDLVPVRNATAAVNAVLRSMHLKPGDELLVTNHGYNACTNAAHFVTERAGARVVVADVPFPLAGEDEAFAAVLAAVGPRTRLALIDHVTSPTGLVLPIERLVRALRERGVETLVDGAHGVGMLPLELDALGAGYYTSNAHKWLCAPKGAAFLHVRRDLQPGVRPAVISHGANVRSDQRSRFMLEFDWCGTDDPTPWLCIPAALRFMERLVPGGFDGLRAHNHALIVDARELLCRTLDLASPAPTEMLGSLASVPLPDGEAQGLDAFTPDPLHTALFDEYRVEVPIHPWPAPPRRLLRISAQAYNEPAEYERLADALRELLARERRSS